MRQYIQIVESHLCELFDTNARLKWTTSDNGEEIYAEFVIDGFRYSVGFILVHWTGKWECLFSLDLDYRKGKRINTMNPIGILGTGNASKVFSVVVKIIDQFIRKHSPRAIEFYADEDSRKKLYASMIRILSKRLPTQYHVRNIDTNQTGNSGVWVIERTLTESRVSDMYGWWITDTGEMIKCDHGNDLHHADIALDELDMSPSEGDEFDEFDRDAALEAALDEGWVRGSAYDANMTIEWTQKLSSATIKTFLTWARNYGRQYPKIVIGAPGIEYEEIPGEKIVAYLTKLLK